MDLTRPYTVLSPTLDSEVLRVLAGTTRPLTGREVSRLVGRLSHSGVLRVLNRLTEHGLVDRQEAGRALLYTLNREHVAAPAVAALVGMRAELIERLRHSIASWSLPPVHASMFGSAARGDGDTQSDIDVFIVRPENVGEDDPTWREELTALSTSVHRWTGNHLGIAEVALAELPHLQAEGRPIIEELRNDAVPLYGPDLMDLVSLAL